MGYETEISEFIADQTKLDVCWSAYLHNEFSFCSHWYNLCGEVLVYTPGENPVL